MAWPTTSRHQRGYGTRHDKIRAELMRKVILCEECTRQGRSTIGTIADHIVPLSQGGSGDRSNYQLLCLPCSDAKSRIEAGKRGGRGVDRSGRPTDPNHPWNRR